MTEHHWPKKGNKAFATESLERDFRIRWMSPSFPHHADTFREAAEMLLDAHIEGEARYHDQLFLPIAYLYRHALELRLKSIIAIGFCMGFYNREKAAKAMNDHSLATLWNLAKKLIIDRWSDGPDVRATESVMNEFHQADPTSQAFRYQVDTNRNLHTHETLPESISPTKLRSTMNGVFAFLDACRDGLDDSLQNMVTETGYF
jgi:hypothetical protein